MGLVGGYIEGAPVVLGVLVEHRALGHLRPARSVVGQTQVEDDEEDA